MNKLVHFFCGLCVGILIIFSSIFFSFSYYEYESFPIIVIVVTTILFVFIASGYIYFSFRQYKNEKCYTVLQDYINEKLNTIPEFQDKAKRIQLLIMEDNIFQGTAIPSKFIILSKPWYHAASVHNSAMSMVKSTICHELYHMSVHRTLTFPCDRLFIALRIKKFRDKYCILSWQEEFWADRKGCEWFGDKDVFIEKMKSMNSLYPTKKKFSTHPPWEMRIMFIENDIEPTYDAVKETYENYYYSQDQ